MNRTLQNRLRYGSLCSRLLHGEMAERFNAAVLKTAVGQPTVGSNPTLSASFSVRALPVFAEQKKAGEYDDRPGIPGTALSVLSILPPS